MKISSVLAFILLMTARVYAQVPTVAKSCCAASALQTFAELGKDVTFVATHLEPLPFALENKLGKEITFPVNDGKAANAYLIKSAKKSDKWVFVIHEWWGLNDYIRLEADCISKELKDVNVIALDLYDGKLATTREKAGEYMQAADVARIESIIIGASDYVGEEAKIATIGWCFGGGWSHKTAILLADKVKACVIYYGMPIIEDVQLEKLKAPVLGIFAIQDGWINGKVVSDFEAAMKKNKKSLKVYSYDADHAFANPSNPKFNAEYTKDAWMKSMDFIKKNL